MEWWNNGERNWNIGIMERWNDGKSKRQKIE
jgi:hypothetical protein